MRAAVWLCQPLLLCSLLSRVAACGSAWSGGLQRLVWDLLSAQDASHLVLVHDRSPAADALWPSCSTWSSELRRAGVYQTVLSTSAPLERLDRTVTSHQGQTMVLLAADPDTSLDFIVRLNGSHRLDESFQLLVLVNGTDYRAALAEWYLPINNQLVLAELWLGSDGSLDRADLLEIYRLSFSHPVRWLRLGRWSASAGLWDWTGESLYERRGDWSGLTLRVATNQDPPLISFEPGPPDDVGGYVGTAWKILADILRFNYTTRLSVDGQWGSQLDNDSWNGVVGMLERQEVDVGVTTLISTAPRRRVISFTRGLLTLRYRVFVRQSSTLEYSWTTYVAVFSPPLWAALVGCVLLGGAAMALLCRLEQRHLPHLAGPHGGTHWRDAALFCIAALSQQGVKDTPAGLATRLFFWVFYMTMVTLSAAYSATLVSSLAVRTYPLPFQDLHGLVRTNTHRLVLPDASALLDFFKDSQVPLLQEVYRSHSVVLGSVTNGVEQLLSGENVAVFSTYFGPNHKPCSMVDLGNDYMISQASLALQRHSPYRAFFDYHLARMRELGILDQLNGRFLSLPRKACKSSDSQGLSLSSVFSAFVFLAAATLASVVGLAVEHLYVRHHNNRTPK